MHGQSDFAGAPGASDLQALNRHQSEPDTSTFGAFCMLIISTKCDSVVDGPANITQYPQQSLPVVPAVSPVALVVEVLHRL